MSRHRPPDLEELSRQLERLQDDCVRHTEQIAQVRLKVDEQAQQNTKGLELLQLALGTVTKLDEQREKTMAALLIVLNGTDKDGGLIAQVREINGQVQAHLRKCEVSTQTNVAGKLNAKTAIITGIFGTLCALIGGLFAIWAAHLGK